MSASNEFKKLFTPNNLEDIFHTKVKYNSASGIDRIKVKVFENNLTEELQLICRKVNDGTFHFSQFREKLLSRGATRNPRVISIPTIRNKVALKALFKVLYSVYGSKNPILHQVVTNVTRSVSENKFDSVLRLDVKEFYPSIDHKTLLSLLRKKIKKKEILNLLISAVSQKTVAKPTVSNKGLLDKGIPQGLSISNVLANIYMAPIDQKYKNWKSLYYFRYVDDILILCNKNRINGIKAKIIHDCCKLGLQIHDSDPNKFASGKIATGFSYLGYKFKDSLVTVRDKSLNNLRESIIKIFTNYKYSDKRNTELLSWTLNLRISGCIFNDKKYGWMFYFSQINDLQLLASLDHFVKKQLIRFGIDPKSVEIKKFSRAYYETKKNIRNLTYVPNFDILDINEKRRLLSDVFGMDTIPMTPDEIEYFFARKIYKTVKELEKDLSRLS